MQRAALLTRQPTINLSYINLDPVITEVSQCPSLLAAELKIRAAFYWLKDLRSHPEFHRMEKRLEDACRGVCRQLPTDLRCGAFVLYCFLCPISLLSKRLQDDLWLNELEDLLRSSKSRQLTCEALLSLALLECDSRKALRRLVVILSEVPEQNLVGGTVAQAASEVILASLNAVQEALADDVVRIAHEVMEDELRRDPPPLPQLHGIFRFLRLSLWAAHNAGIRFEGLIAEQLPILLAVSRSKCAGIRSLAVAALTSLVPSDGPFDRYMVTQARACPLGANEHPNGFRANVSWQGPDESPFEAFLATSPTTDTYRAVMARFYAGHDGATDWRSLAFALVEIIEDPDSLSALGLETNPNIRAPTSQLWKISLTCLWRLCYMDALVQAREAVQSHPTCAFAHCVLSLFPDYVEGLKAAKKGLALSLDMEPISRALRRAY
ncbi:hypothetical protein C8T65DRAFT_743250 [Cerioporus squamosus]|nr:hypothetical protein C8T65DRAFT_743250 [Cerioporus squamosus]